MPQYRVTIRHGAPRQQYHVVDVIADSLRDAMLRAADHVPDASTQPDLVEIRLHQDPELREYTAG